MSNYVISCCSTADLTKEHFEKRNISYICFHYELNGKEYADKSLKEALLAFSQGKKVLVLTEQEVMLSNSSMVIKK